MAAVKLTAAAASSASWLTAGVTNDIIPLLTHALQNVADASASIRLQLYPNLYQGESHQCAEQMHGTRRMLMEQGNVLGYLNMICALQM